MAQRALLEDWLQQLGSLCRSYRLSLSLDPLLSEIVVVAEVADTVIGLGLHALRDNAGTFTGYELDDSILDGVWLVETPAGLVEQRHLPDFQSHRDEQT